MTGATLVQDEAFNLTRLCERVTGLVPHYVIKIQNEFFPRTLPERDPVFLHNLSVLTGNGGDSETSMLHMKYQIAVLAAEPEDGPVKFRRTSPGDDSVPRQRTCPVDVILDRDVKIVGIVDPTETTPPVLKEDQVLARLHVGITPDNCWVPSHIIGSIDQSYGYPGPCHANQLCAVFSYIHAQTQIYGPTSSLEREAWLLEKAWNGFDASTDSAVTVSMRPQQAELDLKLAWFSTEREEFTAPGVELRAPSE